jgi:hypothetical protein
VIFSTYQSSPQVAAAYRKHHKPPALDLAICDERLTYADVGPIAGVRAARARSRGQPQDVDVAEALLESVDGMMIALMGVFMSPRGLLIMHLRSPQTNFSTLAGRGSGG